MPIDRVKYDRGFRLLKVMFVWRFYEKRNECLKNGKGLGLKTRDFEVWSANG